MILEVNHDFEKKIKIFGVSARSSALVQFLFCAIFLKI